MNIRLLTLAAVAALALPALAQQASDKPGAKPAAKSASGPVATVNGVAIPRERLDYMLQQQVARGAPNNDQTRDAVREDLINRELVAQVAVRSGTAKRQEVQLQMEMALQEVLASAYINEHMKKNAVTDADVQREYDRVRTQAGTTEYRARHILVETEEEAKRILAELKKGGKFEELARKSSKDQGTRERGGDLDWNVPAAYDKAFSDAMVKLEKGQITSEPVHSRFGFHLIQLEDQRVVNFPPLAQARPKIQQNLTRAKVAALVRELRAKAKVE